MSTKKVAAGTEHQITYREEVLSRFFNYIKGADSFYVVGAASMGKTRLLDFLMRSDVRDHYLGNEAKNTWLVRVDLNRMPANKDWGFYFFELLLNSTLLCCISQEKINEEIARELNGLDSEVIKSHDVLLALRFFELGVTKICQKYDIKLCYIFDEFDEAYKEMPREIFSQLRGVRDANKNFMLFTLFMRMPPSSLRPTDDNESFYELLSGNALGIGPYGMTDTLNIIQFLEQDWNLSLNNEIKEKICAASGGHPGMIKALMRLAKNQDNITKMENVGWVTDFFKQRTITDECEKIWLGLGREEKQTLLAPFNGEKIIDRSVVDLLKLKGILKDNGFFSPFFDSYLRSGKAKIKA